MSRMLVATLDFTRTRRENPVPTWSRPTLLLILAIVLVSIAAGYAVGGSLRRFEGVRIHWWGVAFAGLLLPRIPLPNESRSAITAVIVASYVLLIAFVWVNRRLPAAPLMLAGLLLNLAVAGTNAGMPVNVRAAEIASGGGSSLPAIGTDAKHHPMTDADVLRPLGDVIPVPPPLGDVLSVGDVLLYAGVASFLVLVMLGRSGENRRPPARWLLRYRGKHLPPEQRLARRYRIRSTPPRVPAVAGRSGI
jgi:Family of unknown function (DUF5317)